MSKIGQFVRFCNVLDEKMELSSIFYKFVINHSSPRRTFITWTYHFVIPSLLECFASPERPRNFFQPRNPLPNSSLGKNNHWHNNPENKFVRILNCCEFRIENSKRIFYSFFYAHKMISMITRAQNYCYLFFYFIYHSRSFPSKK